MARYLDPKADVVFKKVFGEHPHLLKSFLNAVLPLTDDQQIVDLETLPPEQVPDLPILKRTIADVRCKDAKGRHFIVEMQIEWSDSFKQRLLFSAGQAFVKQLKKGEGYRLLEPVYGLGIIADCFDPDKDIWYHHYQLVNIEKPKREVIEHLQLVFIELPKFPIKSKAEKQLRLLWLRFLREIDENTKTVPSELRAVAEISEAIDLSEQAAYTEGELQSYESYWDQISREKTLLSEWHLKGRVEGLAEGLEKKALEIARTMKLSGMSIDQIQKFTGLSKTVIEKL